MSSETNTRDLRPGNESSKETKVVDGQLRDRQEMLRWVCDGGGYSEGSHGWSSNGREGLRVFETIKIERISENNVKTFREDNTFLRVFSLVEI